VFAPFLLVAVMPGLALCAWLPALPEGRSGIPTHRGFSPCVFLPALCDFLFLSKTIPENFR